MGSAKDMTGMTFDRLYVDRRGPNTGYGFAQWYCFCICGTEVLVLGSNLRKRNTKSCGCWRADVAREINLTHGKYGTPEYFIWAHMKARCENPNDPAFDRYGGRGITLDWISFETFFADMGERPSPKHSIDRIDNNGPYSKANCRWTTVQQQARNRRSNRVITWRNETHCLAEWAEILHMHPMTLQSRLNKWDKDRAFTHPVNIKKRNHKASISLQLGGYEPPSF